MTADTAPVDAIAGRHGLRIAVAESLTGGQVSSALAAGRDAGTWYCGGVVAHLPHVKFEASTA